MDETHHEKAQQKFGNMMFFVFFAIIESKRIQAT